MKGWKLYTFIHTWKCIHCWRTFVEAVEGKRKRTLRKAATGIAKWIENWRNNNSIDIWSWNFSHVVHLVELRRQGSLEVKFILEMAFLCRICVLMAECGCENGCRNSHLKQMRFHSTFEFLSSVSWRGFYLYIYGCAVNSFHICIYEELMPFLNFGLSGWNAYIGGNFSVDIC